jgi:hypothetical protein
MEQDSLAKYLNGGADGRGYEALRTIDPKILLWNMLADQVSDPLLVAVMQLMLAGNKETASAEAEPELDSRSGEIDVRSRDHLPLGNALESLNYVARMLGACSTCCGQVASCTECGGNGKPGSFASIASPEEFRAWIDPALSRMGMRIADPPQLEVPTTDNQAWQLSEAR